MNKKQLAVGSWQLVLMIVLSSCGGMPTAESDSLRVQASPAQSSYVVAVTSVTTSPSPTVTATPDLYSALYPSQTALALYQEQLNQQEQALQLQLTSDSATSAAVATITQYAVINAQGTEAHKTQVAGTQTAYPLTQTPIAATQQIEYIRYRGDQLIANAKPVLFILFVIGLFFVIGLLIRKTFGWVEEYLKTKNLQKKTDALKPDTLGRFPLVPSSSLNNGETLINANLSHRAVIHADGSSDDLSAEQALANTANYREATVLQTFASSSAIGRMRQKLNQQTQNQNADVKITKPDLPALTSSVLPALPLPHYKSLFNWDGQLLPFGVDKQNALMQADPSINPHYLIAGKTRSGKTISSIRPMVACLLAMGWNVIVLGKRVDFMPFEGRENFRLIAGDVRKDASKPVNILLAVTAQMDIRDMLLSEKRINTWGRYGAPSTMVVIDDYSGYVERMPKTEARQFVSEVKSVSMDGAKFGLHLMIGLQSVTWENIDTTIRKQMSRIVYSVSASDSRIALDDTIAARLPQQWNFMTKLTDDSDIEQGVGFALQDMEVEAFLKSRPVKENEPMDWIDAVVMDVTESEVNDKAEEIKSPAMGESEAVYGNSNPSDSVKIRKLYMDAVNQKNIKLSLRMIEKEVFGYTGGKATTATLSSLARFEGCKPEEVAGLIQSKVAEWKQEIATTKGATTSEMPDLSPEMA